jgi:hypothetical protein
MENDQASELERRVDEVLFYEWDPLAFKGEPFTRNEYRCYVQEVLSCLEHNYSSEVVAELLTDIVENRMGLAINRESALTVGKLLIRHKRATDTESN